MTINQGDIAIIADDLTGACDCGVEFVGVSPVRVDVFGDAGPPSEEKHGAVATTAAPGGGMLVINTQSRDATPGRAAEAARGAARRARASGARIILKKTDSAFRGNYAAELLAVISEIGPRHVVIAHAIPDFGRTTIDGVQLIDGVPADRSFYAADPMHRAPGARPADLLAESSLPITTVSLATLRSGTSELAAHSGDPTGAPAIFVVDGESNADLDRTVELFLSPQPTCTVAAGSGDTAPVLFVGGQGIAAALARRARVRPPDPSGDRSARSAFQAPDADTRQAAPSSADSGVLIVAGSRHPATVRQVAQLSRRIGCSPVEVTPDSGLHSEVDLSDSIATCGAGIQITSAEPAQPELLERTMAGLCTRVLRRARVSALFLTGGNTALAVLRELGIPRLDLLGKAGTGAVLSRAETGDADGTGGPAEESGPAGATRRKTRTDGAPAAPQLLLCIKGGSLGEDDVMERFVRLCLPSDGVES